MDTCLRRYDKLDVNGRFDNGVLSGTDYLSPVQLPDPFTNCAVVNLSARGLTLYNSLCWVLSRFIVVQFLIGEDDSMGEGVGQTALIHECTFRRTIFNGLFLYIFQQDNQ